MPAAGLSGGASGTGAGDDDDGAGAAPGGAGATLVAVEREHIQRVLDATNWNKKRAARVLEIGRETLYRKIDEFNLGWWNSRKAGIIRLEGFDHVQR